MQSRRLWLHMSQERAEQMEEMAKEYNLSLSQFLAMTAWLGANQLVNHAHTVLCIDHVTTDCAVLSPGNTNGEIDT